MACTIPIPFWPGSPDCLDWSADNQIAVTGGENVAIVSPRLKDKGPQGRLWDTTILQVNSFTAKELPLFDPPLNNAKFSLGEDLSLREAIEAKWSPLGLARRKGCALAVLTANHVLSIWAPDGGADKTEDWRREFVVNRAVADYYENNAATQQNGTSSDMSEQQQRERNRIRQRIRAFVWSPSLMRRGRDFEDEEHYLAVSTEGGDILFLRVETPFIGPRAANEWKLTVIGFIHAESHAKNLTYHSIKRARAAEALCWDRWKTGDAGIAYARFAYVDDGKLYTTSIKRYGSSSSESEQNFVLDTGIVHLGDRTHVSGPIRFVPDDQRTSLIAFGEDALLHVDLDGDADTLRSHHLDGRWDEVSGTAFTNSGDGHVLVHITSLMSMSTAKTTTLSLPLQEDETSTQPAWQHAILEAKAVYSADFNLDGHVLEHTSGIASSPMGDYVATCTTMHPSDCIQYVINIDQKSALNITWENRSSGTGLLPDPGNTPLQSPSAEALLFSLTRQLERKADSGNTITTDHGSVVAELLRHSPFRQDVTSSDETPHNLDGPEAVFNHFKREIFLHSNVLAAQASRIADIALKPNIPQAEFIRPVVRQIMQEVLKLPKDVAEIDDLSAQMQKTMAVVKAKLDPSEQAPQHEPETCKICQQPVPFESLMWAKCTSGHQFSRCSLSFLSIQEPGTTKSCGICGSQYLNEKVFADMELTTDNIEMVDVPKADGNIDAPTNGTWVEVSRNPNAVPSPTRSLAKILFAACGACVYCGGKFVD